MIINAKRTTINVNIECDREICMITFFVLLLHYVIKSILYTKKKKKKKKINTSIYFNHGSLPKRATAYLVRVRATLCMNSVPGVIQFESNPFPGFSSGTCAQNIREGKDE
jgi:hypothetical protein